MYRGDEPSLIENAVIEEGQVCLSVTGQELAVLMCTPTRFTAEYCQTLSKMLQQ
jgi:hypothetical protein